MTTKHNPTPEERDERVKVPLPPDVAVKAFLAVKPDDTDADPDNEPPEDR